MLKLRDGRLHLFQRIGSPNYYYRWFSSGRYNTRTTKTSNLALAKSLAENEYDRHQFQSTGLGGEKLHSWHEGETHVLRSLSLDENRKSRLETYRIKFSILRQFFSDIPLEQIKPKTIEEYVHWRKTQYTPTRPNFHKRTVSNKTISRDLDVLRKVLNYAVNEEWIGKLPAFPTLSITPRAGGWFTKNEWSQLRTTAKKWIADEKITEVERKERSYLYDFMMFMVHVGCRVDEAIKIRYQDCVVSKDNPRFTYITITGGKLAYLMRPTRMVGMFGATDAIKRRKIANPDHKPSDLIFPYSPRDLLVTLLKNTNLLYDDRGERRSAKSFRHTYIMFRILQGVDVFKLAKNCRTSVDILSAHYASYIDSEMSFDELTKMKKKSKETDDDEERNLEE